MQPFFIQPPYDENANKFEFVVRCEPSGSCGLEGNVYPIIRHLPGSTNPGWWYTSALDATETDEVEEAEIWFHFYFGWHGCWQGKIHFPQPDNDYWFYDLDTMVKVRNLLEMKLKELIRATYPDKAFDD